MRPALSTCWRPDPKSPLADTLRIAREIGFEEFEIGVNDAPVPVADLAARVRAGEIRIHSVHNLCPRRRVLGRNSHGDYLGHSSEGKRRRAVDLTLETIDVAREVGASVVVVHLGSASFRAARRRQFQLLRYVWRLGRTIEVAEEGRMLLRRRAETAGRVMDAVRRSVSEILQRQPDAVLAIENRYFFYQVPLPDELAGLFRDFPEKNLRFCYDVGHAHALDAIGLVPHPEWLARFGDRLSTVHVHDVVQGYDHLPPGAGHFDFATLKGKLPSTATPVIEISSGFPASQIAAAKRFVERHL